MGGGSGDTFDAAFNAGMLELSEEQQEWAKEFKNFAWFGVNYDPNEKGYIDPGTGEFIASAAPVDKTESVEGDTSTGHYETVQGDRSNDFNDTEVWVSDVPEGTGAPEGVEMIRRGDTEEFAYDFENPPPSFMDMTTAQIGANLEMIPSLTAQGIAEADLGTDAAEEAQRIIKLGKDAGLPEAEIKAKLAEAGLSTAESEAALRLLPQRERLTGGLLSEQETNIGLRKPVTEAFYKSALEGVDSEKRVAQAGGDVAKAFKGGGERAALNLSRYGADPGEGRGQQAFSEEGLAFGSKLAGARTQARTDAEKESFKRLETGVTSGPAIDVY